MKATFRQSMAWLHTWTGLLLGWLLFAVFATGTAAFFQEEITRWMTPEITATAGPAQATEAAVAFLQEKAPTAESWFITPPSARNPATSVFWRPGKQDGAARRNRFETSATLDGQGQPIAARETRGGFFLYRFHFDLHYMPVIWARYIVGVASMLMFIAILSGIITHKKIFADFFMLRFGKGQRSWLDTHNVTAVFALPFHLMITYTGLVTLAILYMPWGVAANYANSQTFFEAVNPAGARPERTGLNAPLVPIAPLMREASQAWGGAPAGSVFIVNPGDSSTLVTLSRSPASSIGSRAESLTFEGATGRLLEGGAGQGAAFATQSVMIGLHAGRFAGWGLRWLYFLSGVAGTIMVGSGLVLWTVKRRARLADPERPYFGFRLVERLNIAVIAGLPAGIAVYFLANRLLPLEMAGRAQWEIHCLFIAWGAMLAWAVARPARRAWVEGLVLAAALYALVPLVNALTVPRNLVTGLFSGDWLFVAFDITMLLLAAGFAFAARRMARGQRTRAPALRRPRQKAVAT